MLTYGWSSHKNWSQVYHYKPRVLQISGSITWLSIKSFVSWSPFLIEHWLVSDTRPWQLLFSPRLLFITMSLGPSLKDWHRRATPLISTAPEDLRRYTILCHITKALNLDSSQHWMSCNCGACHFVSCWVDGQVEGPGPGPQAPQIPPGRPPDHGSPGSPGPRTLHSCKTFCRTWSRFMDLFYDIASTKWRLNLWCVVP